MCVADSLRHANMYVIRHIPIAAFGLEFIVSISYIPGIVRK